MSFSGKRSYLRETCRHRKLTDYGWIRILEIHVQMSQFYLLDYHRSDYLLNLLIVEKPIHLLYLSYIIARFLPNGYIITLSVNSTSRLVRSRLECRHMKHSRILDDWITKVLRYSHNTDQVSHCKQNPHHDIYVVCSRCTQKTEQQRTWSNEFISLLCLSCTQRGTSSQTLTMLLLQFVLSTATYTHNTTCTRSLAPKQKKKSLHMVSLLTATGHTTYTQSLVLLLVDHFRARNHMPTGRFISVELLAGPWSG